MVAQNAFFMNYLFKVIAFLDEIVYQTATIYIVMFSIWTDSLNDYTFPVKQRFLEFNQVTTTKIWVTMLVISAKELGSFMEEEKNAMSMWQQQKENENSNVR